MRSEPTRVADVFGTQRYVPPNYVEREHVDNELLSNLERGRHVVVHGGSKQGKTCLRNYCLDDKEYKVINSQYHTELIELQTQILKSIGYETEVSNKKTVSGHSKVKAKVTSKIPGIGGGEASVESQKGSKNETVTKSLELDPKDVNDIIRALDNANIGGYIVIEDFHYLPIEVQKQFASSLKALHERTDITFIIVGVWLEENRLIVHSGDLAGRVISVDADSWNHKELKSVIDQGEEMLNLKFRDEFKNKLVRNCYDSVYIVQESCLRTCQSRCLAEQSSRNRSSQGRAGRTAANRAFRA